MKTGMHEEKPLISVIVPVYNVGEYLQKCILSICSQSNENLQIILVDDGSTDESFAVCRKFAETDSRIILIRKENGGLVSARKEGMKVASGMYISFVDGDDWIDLDMYERLIKQAAEHSYPDIVAFGHVEEHESFSVKAGNRFAGGLWNISSDGLSADEALMTESFFPISAISLYAPAYFLRNWIKYLRKLYLVRMRHAYIPALRQQHPF